MNYINRVLSVFYSFWPATPDPVDNSQAPKAPRNIEKDVAEIWQVLHSVHPVSLWDGDDGQEIIVKLQNIFSDESFAHGDYSCRCGGGDAETSRKLVDIFLIVAMTAENYQHDMAFKHDLSQYFKRLTTQDINDVLNRTVILKAETGKAFLIPTRNQFIKTANCYVQTIDKLGYDNDGAWKKRVYLIQFLNYLANNREVHVWPHPSLHKATMDKIGEWEEIEQKRLDWHRKIFTTKHSEELKK